MIKLIATDMDGTFLNDQNQFPDDFYLVFRELNERGIIFAAASGRQYYNLAERFNDIKDEMLFIAENGTYVVYKGEEIFSQPLDREIAFEMIKMAREIENTDIVLCGKQSAYFESSHKEFQDQLDKYYTKQQLVDDLLTVEDDILKVAIYDYVGAEQNSLSFFSQFSNDLQVTLGGYNWLDIMSGGANKGSAIQNVQKLLNISANDTMVFGDYLNDFELMQNAYYSFAMANAHNRIKNIARFEAKTNNEAGVTQAIHQYVLSKRD